MAGDRPDWLAAVDTIGDALLTDSSAAAHTYNKTLNITKSYQNTLVLLTLTGTNETLGVQLVSLDALGNQIALFQQNYGCLTGSSVRVIAPVPLFAGGQLQISISTIGPNWTTLGIIIDGLTYPFIGGSQMYRTDLRAYPIGNTAASGNNVAGGTLVAAPGTGKSLLVKYLDALIQAPAAGSAFSLCQATIGLTLFNIGLVGAPGNGQCAIFKEVWPDGLLLDANTGIAYSQAGTPANLTWNVVYDVVL